MDKGDWSTAKAVECDTRDKGFRLDAVRMKRFLLEAIPSAPHGYILGFLRKKNEDYKAKGLVPTLDMLIEDLTQ